MTPLASLSRSVLSFGAIVAIVVGGAVSASVPSRAIAAPTTPSTLSLYLDAPFVQGSYVTTGRASESFDSLSAGACPASIGVGAFSGLRCQVEDAGDYGGAQVLATNDTPTTTGSPVGKYASTDSRGMTITFGADQRYLGMWWSAGSDGNTLKFYQDSTLLLETTTAAIMTKVGTNPSTNWSTWNTDPSKTVTSIGPSPTSFPQVRYFGNPRGYASTNPSSESSVVPGEPFVYLHLIAGGNFSFNKVEFSGTSGFEFDNLVVSSVAQTALPRLVLVSQITSTQKAVVFEPNGSGVQGTMSTQVGTTSAALTTNAFTRPGFTFNGWATAADGSGTRYTDGQNYGFAADLTLYAQWIDNSPPSSGGGSAPPATVNTLAATGSNTASLVGLSLAATVVGLVLLARSRRLRRS